MVNDQFDSNIEKKVAPYGSWDSPINPEQLTASTPSYAYPYRDGENLYWLESRPWENGRSVIVQRNQQGQIRDVLPAPLSARSKVHEYGGTPYIVIDNTLYFCLYDDQRIYRLDLGDTQSVPTPITEENNHRYADFCYDAHHHRLICVAENNNGMEEPINSIIAIPLGSSLDGAPDSAMDGTLDDSRKIITLCAGDDFYAYPRMDKTGKQLCWISWNHPNMPWDNTTLWLADLDNQGIPVEQKIVAGNGDEAIFQPQWSPGNQLYFVSDRDNWWNIYHWEPESGIKPIHKMAAEFATPLWVLGMSTYGFCQNTESKSITLVCCYSQSGSWQLAQKALGVQPETSTTRFETIATDYTQISDIYCDGSSAWMVGATPKAGGELIEYDVRSEKLKPVTAVTELPFNKEYISEPKAISFHSTDDSPKSDSEQNSYDQEAHGFYYPPKNQHFTGESNALPPLIVICHGGPTGATSTALNLKIQYWTSRGFAVLDINYRGSTGYGRGYRKQLHKLWGIADVADVVAGAQYLIDQQLVDPNKIAIRGSSAGGYTVLAALCFHDLFKAGACLYGIGDLETLAKDTHKFESRYLDTLIGPYPEKFTTYQQRSPIHHVDQFHCPVIFFQGLDDKVVPPEQAISMTKALRDKQLPVAYLPFEGEGHGFRKAKTIKQALEAELYFYGKIFDFEPSELLPKIQIDNLTPASGVK